MSLKDFLEARLLDDLLACYSAASNGNEGLTPTSSTTAPEAAHLERYTPARALEDIEAKQKIVKHWPDPMGEWSAKEAEAARAVKEHTLRLLALPYSDHPDYQQEWKP